MRDRRLVLGALLVLASTLLGARLLGTSDGGITVWSVRHDLAAGTALRGADLEPRRVRLDDVAGRYVSVAAEVPRGLVLVRPVGRGELLPAAAVGSGEPSVDVRTVTVGVDRFHVADDLARGERVDVYATQDEGSAARARLLVSDVEVVDVEQDQGRFGGGAASRGVAVAVPVAAVATVVGGIASGTVDVVRRSGPAT